LPHRWRCQLVRVTGNATRNTFAARSGTGATLGRFMNSPMAARVVPYLGRDIFSGLSALAQPANRLLPLVATSPAAR